jgi:hypothetical protein
LLDDSEENKENKLKLGRELYRKEVERDYLFFVAREEKIKEKILKTNLDMVILGRAHGDSFISNPALIKAMSLEDYKREKVDEGEVHDHMLGFRHGRKIQSMPSPKEEKENGREMLGKELITRKYRAVTEGRVVENRTPNYIGTWDKTIPERGLFELYIVDKKLNGEVFGYVEDTLGTAFFNGNFSDELVIFDKDYIYDVSEKGVYNGNLFYEGKFLDGQYEGSFSYDQKEGGEFTLKKFT